jgi:Flp pilus assembly pilin Flp
MKTPSFVPSPAAIAKEGLIVLGGALVAALIIGQLPGVKAWIKAQWGDAQH